MYRICKGIYRKKCPKMPRLLPDARLNRGEWPSAYVILGKRERAGKRSAREGGIQQCITNVRRLL